MEFILSTDLSVLPKEIGFNFDQLKQELSVNLERYRTLVVTEDAIKDAKGDRAKLNKLKTAIEDKRKEVRAQCLAPYNVFADQVGHIVKMIDEPIKAIDSQVKAFDEQKKQEKREQIQEFFSNHVGKCADYITLEQAFNPRWLNATYAIGDIHNEIMARFLQIEDDLKVIHDQKSDFEAAMLEEYAQTQSINKVLAKKMALEERRAKIQTAKQAEEAATKSPAHERVTVETTSPIQRHAPIKTSASVSAPSVDVNPPEEPKTIRVTFYDTTAAFRAEMKVLTEKYNVKYN